MKQVLITLSLFLFSIQLIGQTILPTPLEFEKTNQEFLIKEKLAISADKQCQFAFDFLSAKLDQYVKVKRQKGRNADIELSILQEKNTLGNEGYELTVTNKQICIKANTDTGLFYGIQSLLQLLPEQIQAGKPYALVNTTIAGVRVKDKPKYQWRSFMLDSGRQYQTPEFIKQYIEYMAMLKMNYFHWHLTEGQGWRIEIKKYPKLTSIGSNVASGKEQKGFYTQEEIKDIVAYAKKYHITVVPEIDVPGHSEAALNAYPEYTCFKKAPKIAMAFTQHIFCGGNEKTYQFLQDILDEICELFPSEYIHLGGDEAPKGDWNKCPTCQQKIKQEGLKDAHELQLYFSKRLAEHLKTKNKKVIFWGDVVYHDGTELPDNCVIYWWNWRGHKDLALKNAIKRGHPVICGTNYYTYLNFPLTPWTTYKENRTFDIKKTYEENPCDLKDPNPLVLGMGTCLWTDWYVQQDMIDQRVFPRIYSLAEQMWNSGTRLPFNVFFERVKGKYPLLKELGVNYGPALKKEVPTNYKWD